MRAHPRREEVHGCASSSSSSSRLRNRACPPASGCGPRRRRGPAGRRSTPGRRRRPTCRRRRSGTSTSYGVGSRHQRQRRHRDARRPRRSRSACPAGTSGVQRLGRGATSVPSGSRSQNSISTPASSARWVAPPVRCAATARARAGWVRRCAVRRRARRPGGGATGQPRSPGSRSARCAGAVRRWSSRARRCAVGTTTTGAGRSCAGMTNQPPPAPLGGSRRPAAAPRPGPRRG